MASLFTDGFESYTVGTWTASGMVAAGWEVSANATDLISTAQAHSGSQSARSQQGAIQRTATAGLRSGKTTHWGYRDTTVGSPFVHGVGFTPGHSYYEDSGYLSFLNDYYGTAGTGAGPDDLVFIYTWSTVGHVDTTAQFVAPNVYLDNTWQKFVIEWTLSSFDAGTAWINPDGCVRVTVDNVVVMNQAGLYLTLRDNWGDWRGTGHTPTDNVWQFAYYSFAGYLDDVDVTDDALVCGAGASPIVVVDASTPCCSTGGGGTVVPAGGGQGGGATPLQTATIGTQIACAGSGTVPTAADLVFAETWWAS